MAAGVKEMGSEGKEENSETKNEEEMSFKDTTAITKFAIGLGSMTGMDLVGDGTINMIPQIARAFRVSVPVVAVGAVAAVGAGATIAVISPECSLRTTAGQKRQWVAFMIHWKKMRSISTMNRWSVCARISKTTSAI